MIQSTLGPGSLKNWAVVDRRKGGDEGKRPATGPQRAQESGQRGFGRWAARGAFNARARQKRSSGHWRARDGISPILTRARAAFGPLRAETASGRRATVDAAWPPSAGRASPFLHPCSPEPAGPAPTNVFWPIPCWRLCAASVAAISPTKLLRLLRRSYKIRGKVVFSRAEIKGPAILVRSVFGCIIPLLSTRPVHSAGVDGLGIRGCRPGTRQP